MLHGRAHEGLLHLAGVDIEPPEHAGTLNSPAFAHVSLHNLDAQRDTPDSSGVVATFSRAIVARPPSRHELQPLENKPTAGPDPLIEAQIPAQPLCETGFREGETLVVSAHKARESLLLA